MKNKSTASDETSSISDSQLDCESQAESGDTGIRRFKKRYLILLLPAVLLILLIAAAPGAVHRERQYREAVQLLESGDLSEAEQILTELPSYRDSNDLRTRRIPYLRACELLDAADAGDESMLEPAGISRSSINEETTVSMLLYQAASNAFTELQGYEDSDAKKEECLLGIQSEKKKLEQKALQEKEAAYQDALELLNQNHYSEALARFTDLRDFSDSAERVLECRYRKAVSIYQFLCRYDVSRIYASVSMDPSQNSIFSLPSEEALRLGGGCVEDLRSSCGGDPTDVRLEDKPDKKMKLLKDELSDIFKALGNYSDSNEYPARILAETDYTKDFFMLCSTGDLSAAQKWLKEYGGVFPDRKTWQDLLDLYLPFCGHWVLYLGDSGLLPFTLGQNFTCMSVSTRVLLNRDSVLLRLSFGDGDVFQIDLPSEFGQTFFHRTDLQSGIYMAGVNNGHFVYMRYDSNWQLISSSDFIPG